ncbi:MAG TPA: beta-galactosidase [Aggregatilinea sp.]|uniref:beta-galactosidase n=1 Tax=Aggregatilinea sp. TaxID=2806333 RepID=UPI002BFD0CCC|nr:beta-galactosidase [Aggregatilinea sp.]HML20228.1 beta-galactosidase [Aggregatilinea sp.]
MTETPLHLWAFVENSDFQRETNGALYRQDEIALTQHDTRLADDYRLLTSIGCAGVRDAARWYVTHPGPGQFDWSWLDRVIAAAEEAGITLYLDLWHYGYPDWLDLMSADAPAHFAEFARQIALRYPGLDYYCICNEPTLLVECSGQTGRWRPFLKQDDPTAFRQQICRMIIAASRAVLDVRPDARLVLPEPWHATDRRSEDNQAAVLDTVMGLRDAHLGGSSEYVQVVGLNHYRDSTLPPFHRLILNAQARWPGKELWVTETSGPPIGWQQAEWFWWMLAETRLANLSGANVPVFTWAPVFSMLDWDDETLRLDNGVWRLTADGSRLPNDYMLDAIRLAQDYGYLTGG